MNEARLRAVDTNDDDDDGDDVDPDGGVDRPAGAWWGWCGVHGRAGVSTLARALPGGHVMTGGDRDRWPHLPVVAVTRSHAAGLGAASEFARHIAATPSWRVLGLVVVADGPGRLPRELEQFTQLVSGGFERVWRAQWVEWWRRGEPPGPLNVPDPYRQIPRPWPNGPG